MKKWPGKAPGEALSEAWGWRGRCLVCGAKIRRAARSWLVSAPGLSPLWRVQKSRGDKEDNRQRRGVGRGISRGAARALGFGGDAHALLAGALLVLATGGAVGEVVVGAAAVFGLAGVLGGGRLTLVGWRAVDRTRAHARAKEAVVVERAGVAVVADRVGGFGFVAAFTAGRIADALKRAVAFSRTGHDGRAGAVGRGPQRSAAGLAQRLVAALIAADALGAEA